MDEHDWLAERFEANRPHLRAVVAVEMIADPEHLAQLDVVPG